MSETFSEPKSGWVEETLQEMSRQYTESQFNSPQRAADVGDLCIDEVKIKEGLFFEPSANKQIGFVDNYHGNEDAKDILATHITQFYFKSLLSKFAFLGAYFLDRNVTADQMTEIFGPGCVHYTTTVSLGW